MKKPIGIILLLLATVLVCFAVLSINVELNLRLRMKAHEILGLTQSTDTQPSVFFLDEDIVMESAYADKLLALHRETGMTYFDLNWLRPARFTYHYDEQHDQLNIAGPETLLIISGEGRVLLNGAPLSRHIQPLRIGEDIFLPYEDIAALPVFGKMGIRLRPLRKNEHFIFYNEWIPYMSLDLKQDEPVFKDAVQMEQYRQKKTSLSSFYRLRDVFRPTVLLEAADAGQSIAYADPQGLITVITSQNNIGVLLENQERIGEMEKTPVSVPRQAAPMDERVMLTWEAVYSVNPDPETIAPMPGVNVVAPTWYELTDSNGTVSSRVSLNYLNWANENNYQVWALVSNAFDIDRTHEFLHDAHARNHFIETMIDEALNHGYHGINVDFEHIYMADRDRLSHFINELAYATDQNGLILSMDVTIMGGSDNWSKCYDHAFLGKIVDYLIIMTYDEYWASSPISGPVASYDWVDRSMQELAEVVEPEKLVLGLPFYTRVWREWPSPDRPNRMANRSSAIGMAAQNNFIENNELIPIWDDEDKLYYASFIDGESLVKIWIENAETLSHKAQLVNELGLGGIAGWQRGFATDDVWDKLRQVIFE